MGREQVISCTETCSMWKMAVFPWQFQEIYDFCFFVKTKECSQSQATKSSMQKDILILCSLNQHSGKDIQLQPR